MEIRMTISTKQLAALHRLIEGDGNYFGNSEPYVWLESSTKVDIEGSGPRNLYYAVVFRIQESNDRTNTLPVIASRVIKLIYRNA
jgi:hypothetical protein